MPGIGAGPDVRPAKRELLVGEDKWVSKAKWDEAIRARKQGIITEAEFAVALGNGEDITSGEGEYKAVETFNDGTYEIPYYKIDPIAVTDQNMDEVIIDGGFHTREDVYLNIR